MTDKSLEPIFETPTPFELSEEAGKQVAKAIGLLILAEQNLHLCQEHDNTPIQSVPDVAGLRAIVASARHTLAHCLTDYQQSQGARKL